MTFLGIDIGGTKIAAGIVDQGIVTKYHKVVTNARGTQEDILKQITDVINFIINPEVEAIGIAFPSIMDPKAGVVFEVENLPALQCVSLKNILETKYHIPLHINNDANCFALGEKHYGIAKTYQHIAGITIGTGLGVGLILNGQLYEGNNCGAGECGSILYKDNTLEYYCSGKFFIEKKGMTGEEAYQLALKKDSLALASFEEFGFHLGKALAVVINVIDPEIIVIGGSISQAYEFFERAMHQSLQESVYKRCYERLVIKKSTLEHANILGASVLCQNQ